MTPTFRFRHTTEYTIHRVYTVWPPPPPPPTKPLRGSNVIIDAKPIAENASLRHNVRARLQPLCDFTISVKFENYDRAVYLRRIVSRPLFCFVCALLFVDVILWLVCVRTSFIIRLYSLPHVIDAPKAI